MKHRKATKSSNGLAAQSGRPKGHATALGSSRAPLHAAAEETPHHVANGRGRVSSSRDTAAASVDARETSVAGAARCGAACSDREACAEAAPVLPRPPEAPPPNGKAAAGSYASPDAKPEEELAQDAHGFVEDMHRLVNLYAVGKRFLTSDDDKIAQRAWEKMLELRYGKGAAPAVPEEPPRIDFGDLVKPACPGEPDGQQ